jgi:hypothetical protein
LDGYKRRPAQALAGAGGVYPRFRNFRGPLLGRIGLHPDAHFGQAEQYLQQIAGAMRDSSADVEDLAGREGGQGQCCGIGGADIPHVEKIASCVQVAGGEDGRLQPLFYARDLPGEGRHHKGGRLPAGPVWLAGRRHSCFSP